MSVGAPVRCPQCGRAYAPARFTSGRVLDCACGARVAAESIARSLPRGADARLFADAMLGRLARWLRIIGFDTAYVPDIADAELVRRSLEERRVILTRDRRLPGEWRIDGVVLLHADETMEQLRAVLDRLDLWPHLRLFTRCSRCNAPLRKVAAGEVSRRVPPAVRARVSAFTECPICARIYWHGSHTGRVRRVLEMMRASADESRR